MATPFDHFENSAEGGAPRVTSGQRRVLTEMGLEKAELIGLDLDQANDKLDEWFRDMTQAQAGRCIARLGRELDALRRERDIPLPQRANAQGVSTRGQARWDGEVRRRRQVLSELKERR